MHAGGSEEKQEHSRSCSGTIASGVLVRSAQEAPCAHSGWIAARSSGEHEAGEDGEHEREREQHVHEPAVATQRTPLHDTDRDNLNTRSEIRASRAGTTRYPPQYEHSNSHALAICGSSVNFGSTGDSRSYCTRALNWCAQYKRYKNSTRPRGIRRARKASVGQRWPPARVTERSPRWCRARDARARRAHLRTGTRDACHKTITRPLPTSTSTPKQYSRV